MYVTHFICPFMNFFCDLLLQYTIYFNKHKYIASYNKLQIATSSCHDIMCNSTTTQQLNSVDALHPRVAMDNKNQCTNPEPTLH
jgi:hypothetical protein